MAVRKRKRQKGETRVRRQKYPQPLAAPVKARPRRVRHVSAYVAPKKQEQPSLALTLINGSEKPRVNGYRINGCRLNGHYRRKNGVGFLEFPDMDEIIVMRVPPLSEKEALHEKWTEKLHGYAEHLLLACTQQEQV